MLRAAGQPATARVRPQRLQPKSRLSSYRETIPETLLCPSLWVCSDGSSWALQLSVAPPWSGGSERVLPTSCLLAEPDSTVCTFPASPGTNHSSFFRAWPRWHLLLACRGVSGPGACCAHCVVSWAPQEAPGAQAARARNPRPTASLRPAPCPRGARTGHRSPRTRRRNNPHATRATSASASDVHTVQESRGLAVWPRAWDFSLISTNRKQLAQRPHANASGGPPGHRPLRSPLGNGRTAESPV